MHGIVVFSSLAEAQNHGFEFFDRTRHALVVRKLTARGWALALVRKPLTA